MVVKWVYDHLLISPSFTNILPSLAWSKPSFAYFTIIEKLHRLHFHFNKILLNSHVLQFKMHVRLWGPLALVCRSKIFEDFKILIHEKKKNIASFIYTYSREEEKHCIIYILEKIESKPERIYPGKKRSFKLVCISSFIPYSKFCLKWQQLASYIT